jgi:4-hydroxy-tetrahydrodipicolinate synthase
MIGVAQARDGWRGVLAPLVTPFKQGGDLDLATLRGNVEWLLERGASQGNTVLLAVGSGGDFPMMNLEERKQALQVIAKTVDGRVPIIAGVQSLDV